MKKTSELEEEAETIVWKIHGDEEYVTGCEAFDNIKANRKPRFKKHIDDNKSIGENYFDLMWPELTGSAKIIDKFLSDYRCPCYATVEHDNIRFHDENADDADWKVKQCMLVLIAAAAETEKGLEGLFKSGAGEGRKEMPDFRKYIPENVMSCFLIALPNLFADEKYW